MASHHKFPALHNAMWPGLVGKGGPGAEPPIDLDTMLNLTAAAQVNGTQVRRRRSVPVRSARQHRFVRRRLEAARRQDRLERTGRRIARRAGLAADRRRVGDGQQRRSRRVSDPGPQGLRDREEAEGSRHPPLRRRPDRLGRRPGGLGDGSGRATRRRSPRRSARRPTSPRTTASGSRPKGRSAGAACTA